MARQMTFERLLLRAKGPDAAAAVVRRVEAAMGRTLVVEVVGPYWKDPELFELRASVTMESLSFAEAVVESFGLLGRLVTSLTDVRVDPDEQTLAATFAASERSPTGTSVAGVEWFSVALP